MKKISWLLGILFVGIAAQAQIRLNQLGFLPGTSKQAVVLASLGGSVFDIIDEEDNVVFTGSLKPAATWEHSRESVRIADFSDLRDLGTYYVRVGSVKSNSFEIGYSVYEDVFKASLKYFYLSRASIDLEPEYAGIYARKGGHPDTLIYNYISKEKTSPSPKGWYDAGDYNKYMVPSGISTYTLMSLYEHFPEYIRTVNLIIPESGNSTPDLLDEVFWNLSWMLTMQDPADGGVYHKLSNEKFDGFIMPEEATTTRYVTQKSSPATQHFVATMAAASRVFKDFQEDYPKYDSIFMAAALKAYQSQYFSGNYFSGNPGYMETGEYCCSRDAKEWAETELYIASRGKSGKLNMPYGGYPHWYESVGPLILPTLVANVDLLSEKQQNDLTSTFDRTASAMYQSYINSAYKVVMGMSSSADFVWGSNGNAANQAYMLLVAFKYSGNMKYLEAALSNIDYLLGKNPTEYSFITGFGHKSPMHPHHRVSEADGIPDPIPGMLVGGPGGPSVSGCTFAWYSDLVCNYAGNEVAINWNAPLAFSLGAINAIISGLPAPFILAHPKTKSFNPGEQYEMRVHAMSNNDDMHFQWYKDGVLLSGQTADRLVFEGLQSVDEGAYQVRIYNTYGSVWSNTAYLMRYKENSDFINPVNIPGIVEAENYSGYSNATQGNQGGAYRTDDMDIYVTDDTLGIFHVMYSGETTRYKVNVLREGMYRVNFRLSRGDKWGGNINATLSNFGESKYSNAFIFESDYPSDWINVKGNNDIKLAQGVYDLSISSSDLMVNYIEFIGLWEDCAGVTGGLHEQDECGVCLLPDDPDYNRCIITSLAKNEYGSARIYPVPASDILYVDKNGGERFEIWNSMGQKVLHNTLNADHRIDISGLSPGSYRIRLIGRDQVEVFPFIKK